MCSSEVSENQTGIQNWDNVFGTQLFGFNTPINIE